MTTMAKRTVTTLVDDIDGTDATVTVYFSWEGVDYSIDLNDKNALDFETVIWPFLSNATRVGGRKHRKATTVKDITTTKGRTRTEREENEAIRAWALGKGYEVAARGRIKQEIKDAYYAAN